MGEGLDIAVDDGSPELQPALLEGRQDVCAEDALSRSYCDSRSRLRRRDRCVSPRPPRYREASWEG